MKYTLVKLIVIFCLFTGQLHSQELATIYGTITDTAGYSIGFANVAISGTKYGTTADRFGQYYLQLPAGKSTVTVTCVGYNSAVFDVESVLGEKKKFNFSLEMNFQNVEEVKVSGRSGLSATLQRIDIKSLSSVPNSSGNIENLIRQLPGVASNNELSSQYSVRGGSFDENLVYVNDIEVFRPLLIRSGQQEGLSFINPDMVGALKFSSGGFDASYGDKMSSVLDVTYKKPSSNAGSVSMSILGATASFEGISKNNKFKHITGIRYKTSKYLLTSMDTKGEYNPTFIDAQTYLTYDLVPKFEISFLGNFSQNKYTFIPDNRTTEFGTSQQGYKFTAYYEGNEQDRYLTAMGALSLNYHVGEKLSLKLIGSAYQNSEKETFDILGQYNISDLDKTSQKKNDSSLIVGIGSFLNHARNKLNSNILSFSHIGLLNLDKNKFKWGINTQNEVINDKVNEWDLIDSMGYNTPYSPDVIALYNIRHSVNDISSQRVTAYILHTIEFSPGNDKIYISSGIRANYWTLNRQTVINPRASISYQPAWKSNLMLYFASGFYNQPAFYKELRDPSGIVNKNLEAQKSIHYILGADYIFYALSRPFKMSTELYYKSFRDLVPYRIDNVRTIYAGKNLSNGYARGIDLKINGEFVKGTESWMSISLLQTKEDIPNDSYVNDSNIIVYPGYFSRPTDQLVNISLFFQDFVPMYPSYKVNLSLHYGSRLPVSFPNASRWDQVFKLLPSYKRVDLGVSKLIKGEEMRSKYALFNVFKEVWISAEIFNLIGINNTGSFMWVKSVNNSDNQSMYFAVPNYLTSRRLNVKLSVSF